MKENEHNGNSSNAWAWDWNVLSNIACSRKDQLLCLFMNFLPLSLNTHLSRSTELDAENDDANRIKKNEQDWKRIFDLPSDFTTSGGASDERFNTKKVMFLSVPVNWRSYSFWVIMSHHESSQKVNQMKSLGIVENSLLFLEDGGLWTSKPAAAEPHFVGIFSNCETFDRHHESSIFYHLLSLLSSSITSIIFYHLLSSSIIFYHLLSSSIQIHFQFPLTSTASAQWLPQRQPAGSQGKLRWTESAWCFPPQRELFAYAHWISISG